MTADRTGSGVAPAGNHDPAPRVLFKYCSLSGDRRRYVYETIAESKIYFSSRTDFNDPLDCRINLSADGEPEEWKAYLERALEIHEPGLSRTERAGRISRFVDERTYERPEFRARFKDDGQKEIDRIGLLCLSSRDRDILMWSYYADGHKGVCLGFRYARSKLGLPLKVRYAES